MKKFRTIENIFKGPEPHMVGDGFRVSQYIPTGIKSMERLSPFLLLDYNAPYYFKPSETRLGVGAHPHRGFETVTIAYDGKVEHHDNKGNHGIIGQGDVQWMTKKMIEPKYQPLLKEEMGVLKLDNDKGEISIIAGEVNGVKGPANTFTTINLYNINLKNYGNTTLSEPKNFNTAILILKGEAKVNEDKICKEGDFIVFENVEGEILLESLTEESLFLVLSGEPINEPVVSHGPFVMNTLGEILDAYKDFRNNKFGTENF